jgi:hypothetical protein
MVAWVYDDSKNPRANSMMTESTAKDRLYGELEDD